MSDARSRRSRRYGLAGIGWPLLWQVTTGLAVSRPAVVTLGLLGFVLHVVLGKAYAFVPAYSETDVAYPAGPAIQFPLVAVGIPPSRPTYSAPSRPASAGSPPATGSRSSGRPRTPPSSARSPRGGEVVGGGSATGGAPSEPVRQILGEVGEDQVGARALHRQQRLERDRLQVEPPLLGCGV